MGTGIFNIGMSGMMAAQKGMSVVQHNVANANTDGYTRQSIRQATNIAIGSGAGFYGQGTQVTTVARQYDEFLTGQVNRAQTSLSASEATADQMNVIDQMLADPKAGISPAMQDFFSAAQQVSSYPSSIAARQSMVSAAQTMTTRFNSIGQRIADLSQQIDLKMNSDAIALNAYADEIYSLNKQINAAGVFNHSPNDLLDKRDKVINEMGKIADISTIKVTTSAEQGGANPYGSIQVYVGAGYLLVGDNGAKKVQALPSSIDATRMNIYIDGKEVEDGSITGGSIGGMLNFRKDILDNATNSLGQVAFSMASTFNAQHATGMDMLGNNKGDANFVSDFFKLPTDTTVTPDGTERSGSLFMQTAPSLAGQNSLGVEIFSPTLTADSTSGFYQTSLSKSDFTLESKAGGNYTLTRKSDGRAVTGTIAAINTELDSSTGQFDAKQGFRLYDPGATSTGVKYLIRPSAEMATRISVGAEVAGDPRLIAAGLAVTAKTPQTNKGGMSASVTRMTDGNPGATVTSAVPLTLTYASASKSLSGFSASSTVKVTLPDGTSQTGSPFSGGASVPYVAGASYNADGIVFSMTGVPSNGDQLILQRNDTNPIGVSDSSNIVLLGQLQSQKTISGSMTYSGAYAQMAADIGNQASAYKVKKDAQQSLLDMSIANKESYSGVNLDEEAANLLYYQQMYQANAKSLQAGQKMFDTLLSVMG
jgi:flagellar hook-associated protein 1